MKNEDFDEAIRKKLESINQTYAESDIDKVFHHAVSKSRLPWKKGSSGSWLFYTISAAAFTVTTFWAISTLTENNKRNFENERIDHVSAQIIDSIKVKTDSLNPMQTLSTTTNVANIDKLPHENAFSSNSNIQISQKVLSDQPKSEKGTEIVAEKVNTTDEQLTSISKVDKYIPESVLPSVIEAVNPDDLADKTKKSEIFQSEKLVRPIPDSTKPLLTIDSLKSKSGLAVLPSDPDSLLPDNPRKEENTLGYLSHHVKVGAGFLFSNQSVGTGIVGEFLISNYFGLETGLQYMKYRTEHFVDKQEMLNQKPPPPNHRIEDHLADKDHVTDISIDNSFVQLPIAFNYYMPLKNNYQVSFSLGSNLGLYLNQKLNYSRIDAGISHQDNFDAKSNVLLVNEIVISSGIQKQWKSFSFQLQPFVKPRLKQVFYKPKEMEFGVGAGIKFGFGK